MTRFFVLFERSMTALRVVRGEYWSTTFTFLPFTKMAALPFFGPATNHSANDLRLTSNSADAPVMEVECTEPPWAMETARDFHADGTGTDGTDDACATAGIMTDAAARRPMSRGVRIPPRYPCTANGQRQPNARTALVRMAFTPFAASGTFHFSRSNS